MQAENPQPSSNTNASPARKSFLLRCWQEKHKEIDRKLVWRFSVREVSQTPQEHHFSTPGQLLDFLATALAEDSEGIHDVTVTVLNDQDAKPNATDTNN